MKRFLGFLICLFIIACAPPSPIIVNTQPVITTDLFNYKLLYNDNNTKVIKFVDNDITCYLASNTALRVSPSIFCMK